MNISKSDGTLGSSFIKNRFPLLFLVSLISLLACVSSVYSMPITGQQKILVIVTGPATTDEANNILNLLTEYYTENSNCKLVFHGDVAGPYSCSDERSNRYASFSFVGLVEDSFDLRNYDRIIIYDKCRPHPFDVSTLGKITVPTKNGYAHVSISEAVGTTSESSKAVTAHELGHGIGLLHSSQDTDVMNPLIYQTWHVNAIQKEDEGWFDKTQMQTVTQSGRFVLTPLESASAGLKVLRIPSGEEFVYVEFRQPIGFDSKTCLDVFNGATLHKRTSNDDISTEYVDPSGSLQMCHAILPGQTYNLPTGSLIKVVSNTNNELTLDVNVDYTSNPVIAHLAQPTMANDFVYGIIPVEAEAYSQSGISKVEFYYSYFSAGKGGTVKFGEASSPPFTANLNASAIPLTPPSYYANVVYWASPTPNPNYWTDTKVWAVVTDVSGKTANTEKAQVRVYSPTGFEDQFNRPDNTNLGNGWSEINGDFMIVQRELRNAGVQGSHLALQQSLQGTDLSAEADFTIVTSGPSYGIVLRYQDPKNYYYLSRTATGKLTVMKIEDGNEKVLATLSKSAPFSGYPFHLKASAVGNNLTLILSGPTDPYDQVSILDSTFSTGSIGLRVDTPNTAYVKINNFYTDKINQALDVNTNNKAPTICAGPDQVINLGQNAQMEASIADDNLPNPPGSMSVQWVQLSGPSQATFDNRNIKNPVIGFPSSGTYVFRVSADDGEFAASDDVTVTVESVGTQSNPAFYDDFNRPNSTIIGNGWEEIKGDFAIMNKDLKNVVNGSSVLAQNGFVSKDMGISVNFTPSTIKWTPKFGIFVRFNDLYNSYYIYRISAGPKRGVYITRIENGKVTVLSFVKVANPNLKVPFNMEARAKGQTLSVYINGKNFGIVKDTVFSDGSFAVTISEDKNNIFHAINSVSATTTPKSINKPSSFTGNIILNVKYGFNDFLDFIKSIFIKSE